MSGPIRGMRNVEGKLLVVSGNQLYQISNAGIAIPRGTVPGVGPVQMSHNQKGNGNEVLIVNGSAGYIYNTSTLVFAKITDEGYPGSKCAAYLASYFLQVEPAGRFWFHSDLADGFSYNMLDRYESEAAPDRIVGLIDSQLEVIVFNETTTEFFVNTGAATGTFQSKGIVIETGCAGSNAYAKLDNTVIWLDDKGVVQRMEGYSARPISTRVLERQISKYKAQWSNAIAYTWEDKGHKVFYLTFPGGYTFGYDVTTGVWTRRKSWGMDRWRLSCLVYWNKKWIGGDYQQDRLYELDWRYMYDGREPHVRSGVTGYASNDQRRLTIPSAEIVFDTGGTAEPVANFPLQPDRPIITGNAPNGSVLELWDAFAYTITGGQAPYTVTLRSGTLPAGIGPLAADGTIPQGLPTTPGTSNFVVRVTDSTGLWSELNDSIVIGYAVPALLTNEYRYDDDGTGVYVEGLALPYIFSVQTKTLSASLNGVYVAAGGVGAPFLEVAKFNGTNYAALAAGTGFPVHAVRSTDFSPDSNWLLATTNNGGVGELLVYRRTGDTFTLSDSITELEGVATWSPDGTKIAWSQNSNSAPQYGIVVVDFDATTGTLGTPVYGVNGSGYTGGMGVQWSSDSELITLYSNSRVWVAEPGPTNVPIVASLPVFGLYPAPINGAYFSEEADFIYTVASSPFDIYTVAVYSYDRDLQLITKLPYPTQPTGEACFDSSLIFDRSKLAIAQGGVPEQSVVIYELNGGVMTPATPYITTTSNSSIAITWSEVPSV